MSVTVTDYKRGPVSQYVGEMAAWDNSDILNNYSICGHSGSWRKIDQQAELILDNLGKFWTKITRHYQKAPGSLIWNNNYAAFIKAK